MKKFSSGCENRLIFSGKDVKHVIKGEFFVGMQYHFHMEVQCCNVVPTEDSLDLYASTQWMDAAQISCSTALNIPMNRCGTDLKYICDTISFRQ